MADEVKITPPEEKIAGDDTKVSKEGSVQAELDKTKVEVKEEKTEAQTVPLSVYLGLKEDVKELKRAVEDAKNSSKSQVSVEGVKELAAKYPQVSEEFIADILTSATSKAAKDIDAKYTPIIQKQVEEKQKEAFDKAFDKVYDKAISDNPELPKTIDKEAIKALALTPSYKNVPLSEILLKLYGIEQKGKSASENEVRNAADSVDDIVNFEKITADQKKAVMADPKARAKYFSWLDTQ